MKMPDAASLHLSMPDLCTGIVNWCDPAQTKNCEPICGGGAPMPLKSTASPVTFVVCQMPFQIMAAWPALRALRSASTGSLGCEYLDWASFFQVSACTPASLFQVACVPLASQASPPNWCSSISKIWRTGKPVVIEKPWTPFLVVAAAAFSNSSLVFGAAVMPAALSRSAL